MFCGKCGTQCESTEAFCHSCGNKLDGQSNENQNQNISMEPVTEQSNNIEPVIEPTPEPTTIDQGQNNMNQSVMNDQQNMQPNNNQPVMNEQQNVQTNNNQPVQNVQPAPKKSNKVLFIVLGVIGGLVVLGIIGIVSFILLAKSVVNKIDTEISNIDTPIVDNDIADIKNTYEYDGYTFEIPEGFTAEEDDEFLTIYDNSLAIGFKLDRTHTYAEYRAAVLQEFPELNAVPTEIKIGSRNYTVFTLIQGTEENIMFITEISGSAIIGSVARVTGDVIKDDFDTIESIISTGKTQSNFAPEDEEKNPITFNGNIKAADIK